MGIVSALFALVAAARIGGAGMMLPRRVWLAVLFVLRPAEAAVRRLVLIAARGLAPVSVKRRFGLVGTIAPADVPREPLFCLFDPLKDCSFISGDMGPGFEEMLPGDFAALADRRFDEPLDAAGLHVRLRALRLALADIAKQARRLARWTARRDMMLRGALPVRNLRMSPVRPGLPPGWRQRPAHDIDPVLHECHRLARDLLNVPDSS